MASTFKARYNEHNAGISNEFLKWFQSGTHVDVTIHAGGQRVAAHKLVLAANSPFFNGVFLDKKGDKSNLYFEDVPFQSMKSLIEYMYSGDLVVEREFLAACLQLGDSLRVRGISGNSMEDITPEPTPVSAEMHYLINTIMRQHSIQKQQQQLISHQTPKQQYTRNQKKKLNRKCKKMLNRIGNSTEKGVPHVTPKLIFKRIKNTSGYKLEKYPLSKLGENNVIVKHNARMPENQQHKKHKDLSDSSSLDVRPKVTQIEVLTINVERENEKESCTSEVQAHEVFKENEMLAETNHEELICTKAASVVPTYVDPEIVDGCNSVNLQHSSTRFQSEVLERKVCKEGADDNLKSLVKKEQNYLSNENVEATDEDPSAKFAGVPRLSSTSQNEINHTTDVALNKVEKKVKSRKLTSKLSTKSLLNQEFERLFGDNHFGFDKKDNSNIKKTLEISDQNEQCKQVPPLKNPLVRVNAANPTPQPKKKNGNRRKTPVCPPPEAITQNGKNLFSCSLCKRVYTHKSNYRRHYMVLHKRFAEAVFQCPMCKKKFTRSDNRTHHIRRIHGYTNTASLLSEEQALFLCPICKKAFTRSYNRAFHLADEHGIKSPVIIDDNSKD